MVPPLRVVLYTFAAWDHALAMLRFVGPSKQAGFELIRGNKNEDVSLDPIISADVVVVQRDFPVFSEGYEQVLERARGLGKPVVLDIDDCLIALPEDHPDYQYQEAYLLHLTQAFSEVDAITVSTPELRSCLRCFNTPVYLLPNYLVDQLWLLRPLGEMPRHEEVIIGYMGGESHLPDIVYIQSVLTEILDRYSQVRLKFWGQHPSPSLCAHPRTEWTPLDLTSYSRFVTYFLQQESDIFIAPLIDNLFNNCKSAIKFLEYSALGVPGIYSQVAPYKRIVKHGRNGFLATSLEEWQRYLAALIESPALRRQIGYSAQRTASRNFLSQHASLWRQAYQEICNL